MIENCVRQRTEGMQFITQTASGKTNKPVRLLCTNILFTTDMHTLQRTQKRTT